MDLELSKFTNQVPTRYLDNQQNSNSVIDLMLFRPDSLEYNKHSIYSDWWLILNYIFLTISIIITKEHIQTRKCIIVKNSKEKEKFITKLIGAIKRLNTENIPSKEVLKQIVQTFANNINRIWYKYSKIVNITQYFKTWWNKNCHKDLEKYRISKWIKDWKLFKSIIKKTKCNFFDKKIQEIANKNYSP